MADARIDMALDDIIKKGRGGAGNRRGRGRGRAANAANSGIQRQQRGGNSQRGTRGRIGRNTANRGRGSGGGLQRGGGRNSFSQRNNNRSTANYRPQRGNGNSTPGFNRRSFPGDKPTATYNPLSRDGNATTAAAAAPKQQTQAAPRKQQGSVFNKIRKAATPVNANVGALRRRMVAAQRALTRATKTLATMPRLKQQRQRFLQQPQQLRNIITRNRVAGGAIRKRLGTGQRNVRGRGTNRGGARRMFV